MSFLALRTVSGSRLYGLATEGSDVDLFSVYVGMPRGRKSQTFHEEYDDLEFSLDLFLKYASHGSPQSLEAMWSRKADVDLLGSLRWNFYPNYGETFNTYRRAVKGLYLKWYDGAEDKFLRHSHRLSMNLDDLYNHGRFDPTLSEDQVFEVNELTNRRERPRHLDLS